MCNGRDWIELVQFRVQELGFVKTVTNVVVSQKYEIYQLSDYQLFFFEKTLHCGVVCSGRPTDKLGDVAITLL